MVAATLEKNVQGNRTVAKGDQEGSPQQSAESPSASSTKKSVGNQSTGAGESTKSRSSHHTFTDKMSSVMGNVLNPSNWSKFATKFADVLKAVPTKHNKHIHRTR